MNYYTFIELKFENMDEEIFVCYYRTFVRNDILRRGGKKVRGYNITSMNQHQLNITFQGRIQNQNLLGKNYFFLTSLFPPLRISGPYIAAQWMITNVLTHNSSKPWCLALESLHMHRALAVRGSQWPKFGVNKKVKNLGLSWAMLRAS